MSTTEETTIIPRTADDPTDAETTAVLAPVPAAASELGWCGQISLGHQAFVGLGAFTSAYLVTDLGMSFWFAIAVAAGFGAVQATLLGMVSLRLTGLYFALVTLAYGAFAENTLFGITSLTGGEGGKPAARPPGFESPENYYYLCLAFLALVIWLDWRLTRTKGGRAMAALRENPRVASAYERGILDLVEAGVLRDRVGEVMTGVVVEVDEKKPYRGEGVVAGPAVEARLEGRTPLPLGEEVSVELVEADIENRRVRFSPA